MNIVACYYNVIENILHFITFQYTALTICTFEYNGISSSKNLQSESRTFQSSNNEERE